MDGLTLEARAGEVLVVLGPNGAGKTSTIESLEGYRRPTSGRITVLGLDPIADHRRLTGRMGVMLQNGGVYPMLGPRRVLDLFSPYYPDPLGTEALLDLVALRGVAATPWRHLSGGEQQRLSLALALIGRPQVVFLDEPTAGVDPEGRLAIRAVVADLRAQGVCVLLTTHELAEAEKMADRIVILSRGRVVLDGTPVELTAATGTAGLVVRRSRRAGHGLAGRGPRGGGTGHARTPPVATGSPGCPGRPRRRRWPPGWPSATRRSATWSPGARSKRSTSRPWDRWPRRTRNRPHRAHPADPAHPAGGTGAGGGRT